jgi:hypothetical protein
MCERRHTNSVRIFSGHWACSCTYTSLRRCSNQSLARQSSALVAVEQENGIAQQTLSTQIMRG